MPLESDRRLSGMRSLVEGGQDVARRLTIRCNIDNKRSCYRNRRRRSYCIKAQLMSPAAHVPAPYILITSVATMADTEENPRWTSFDTWAKGWLYLFNCLLSVWSPTSLIIHCVSKNAPTLASCSFDTCRLILIIFGTRHPHTFKNDMHVHCSTFLVPSLLLTLFAFK